MKCAFAAGVLDQFLEDGITFDEVIGVSAGSANVCSYLGHQVNRNRRFYTVYSHDPKYFGLRSFLHTGNAFGLDYIYSELSDSDGLDPLDYEAIAANPAELVVVATDAVSGKAKYFTKNDMSKDHYEVIKASSALPVVCKPVKIRGRFYYDGGVSDSIPIHKAMRDGCKRMVVLLSKPRGYVMKPQSHKVLYTYILHKYPNIIYRVNHRHEAYNKILSEVYEREEAGEIFLFTIPSDIDAGTYTMDSKVMERLYESGRTEATAARSLLTDFLRG